MGFDDTHCYQHSVCDYFVTVVSEKTGNALAAVETPEITSALNQLPPCPSRVKPKIQKVMEC